MMRGSRPTCRAWRRTPPPSSKWLTECVEMTPRELGQLVQEEHATMRQRGLAGHRVAASPADQSRLGCRVMRGAKRRRGVEPTAAPCGRPEHRGFDGFGDLEPGKDPDHAPGEHRLARSGRAVEQEMMTTRSRHLEGPSRHDLALDVGHVRRLVHLDARLSGRGRRPAAPDRHEADQPLRPSCSPRTPWPQVWKPPRRPTAEATRQGTCWRALSTPAPRALAPARTAPSRANSPTTTARRRFGISRLAARMPRAIGRS